MSERREKTFEPEGFPAAWIRFKGDIEKISHSYPNLGAELFGDLGWPRKLGKVVSLFLLLILVVWLLVSF